LSWKEKTGFKESRVQEGKGIKTEEKNKRSRHMAGSRYIETGFKGSRVHKNPKSTKHKRRHGINTDN
jgi:hypothetical protein